jgi:hypothetical protein
MVAANPAEHRRRAAGYMIKLTQEREVTLYVWRIRTMNADIRIIWIGPQ